MSLDQPGDAPEALIPRAGSTAVRHVRLLGPVQVVQVDGATIDLPSQTQRRLLAMLAVSPGRTLRPDFLSDRLGVSDGALRKTVGRLRAQLGIHVLVTDAGGYRLTCAVDTDLFTQLILDNHGGSDHLDRIDQALALWTGEVLDEFCHEAWAQPAVAPLEELHALAVEDRAELLIARSRHGEALASLQVHIAQNPLRDRARGLLIQALASDGRQADALRAYQDYRTLLAAELGTEPSAHVRSIERRVSAGWADAQSLGRVALHAVLAHGPGLIGRVHELALLESELEQARSGSLHTVLLNGEAGIGKTTLAAAFARAHHQHHGATVLYGRCDEGAAVPLQPFRGIVGSLVEHVALVTLTAHCERFGGELQRVAPGLMNRIDVPTPPQSDDATDRYRLFEAIADLMRRVTANGPLLLVLDDLHWAEPTALLLLRHVARTLVDAPILIVASHRDTGENQSIELRAALADLDRGHTRRISLTGFSDNELADLVVSVVNAHPGRGSDTLVSQLRIETGGNPLYAAHLMRHLMESGRIDIDHATVRLLGPLDDTEIPPSLRDVVWTRVQTLGEVTSQVLSAAAVLGIEFSENVLVDIVDAGDTEVETALDAAIEAGLLVEVEGPTRTLRFTHALVAHALYSELRGIRRRRLHELAARMLLKSVDLLPQQVTVQLARHWAQAGDRSEAQRWSTAAADHAYDHLAPTEAARWYELALDHATALGRPDSERAALMVKWAQAQHRSGDPLAHATFLLGADMARRSGAHDVLVQAALGNDRGFMRLGAVETERLDIIEAALKVVDQHDTTIYARLLALYGRELIHTPQATLRHHVTQKALDLADHSTDPTLFPRIVADLLYTLWPSGTPELRRALVARATAAVDATDDPFIQFRMHNAMYIMAVELADPTLAKHSIDRLRLIASEVKEPRLQWLFGLVAAFETMMEARLDESEQLSNLMLDIGTQLREPDAFALYAAQLFVNWTFAGRHGELFPLITQVMKDNPDILGFRLAYGVICVVVGREDEARQILHEGAANGFTQLPMDFLWKTSIIGYAVLAVELQDAAIAALLYPILEPFGAEVAFNGATSQGYIGAYLGKLASLMGLHDIADAHLHTALDVATAFGWAYHRATTLVALALSQRRRTGTLDSQGTAWLDEAAAICAERGLKSIAAHVVLVRG